MSSNKSPYHSYDYDYYYVVCMCIYREFWRYYYYPERLNISSGFYLLGESYENGTTMPTVWLSMDTKSDKSDRVSKV